MRCERPVRNNLQANAPFDFSPKWENAFGTLKKLYTELATMEAKVKGERESRGGEERRGGVCHVGRVSGHVCLRYVFFFPCFLWGG